MMKIKSLRDISWQVDEATYRADPALSYSTLARYEREGFNNISKLFDKIETPSLTFGSAVDSIITGGQDEFNSRFMVADYPSTPDSIIRIVRTLFSFFSTTNSSLSTIDDEVIIKYTELYNYQPNWKPETRAKVIKEKGKDYYNLLYLAGDKTIIDTNTYSDVRNAVNSLLNSLSTKDYFKENNPFEPEIERLYQLKFKGTFDGIEYRNMADLLYVDHKQKKIVPIDLKTSSHTEWDFYKSFVEWHYDIQARLYWNIIRQNLDNDEYFKDFELLDYRFIVINRGTLTPLVWIFDNTTTNGTLFLGKNKQIEMRDPFDIGRELHYYLTNKGKLPIGIYAVNHIENWIDKL